MVREECDVGVEGWHGRMPSRRRMFFLRYRLWPGCRHRHRRKRPWPTPARSRPGRSNPGGSSRLRSTPRGCCASRRAIRIPTARATASGSRHGGGGPCEPEAVSTRCWTGALARKTKTAVSGSSAATSSEAATRLSGTARSRQAPLSLSPSPPNLGSPRPRSPASRPTLDTGPHRGTRSMPSSGSRSWTPSGGPTRSGRSC
jgi:hypothetical protein